MLRKKQKHDVNDYKSIKAICDEAVERARIAEIKFDIQTSARKRDYEIIEELKNQLISARAENEKLVGEIFRLQELFKISTESETVRKTLVS